MSEPVAVPAPSAPAPESQPAAESDVRTGFVGFFDILGFRSFLQNNSPEQAARRVLRVIENTPEIVRKKLVEAFGHDEEQERTPLEWLIFSDTIVLAKSLPNSFESVESLFTAMRFQVASAFLVGHMFENGLPVRGALAHGEYLIRSSPALFAGSPLIEAHDMAGTLELSACACTESYTDSIKRLLEDCDTSKPEVGRVFRSILASLVVEHLTPTKNGEVTSCLILPLASTSESMWNAVDIRQCVLDSFWNHKKTLPEQARIKADNTETFFRQIKCRRGKRGKSDAAKTAGTGSLPTQPNEPTPAPSAG